MTTIKPKLRVAPRLRLKVSEVFMAVLEQGDQESVFTVVTPRNVRLPVVALDRTALAVLQRYAQSMADETGQTVSIICFTDRSVYESFRPSATGD